MPASTTMTIRVTAEVKKQLGQLAKDTRRSKSFLAAEAIAACVEQELAIINGIQRGLADVEAGRVVSHEEAMAELDAVVGAARRKRT